MIGGNNKKIILPQIIQQNSKIFIKSLNLMSVANRIAPVSPLCIKINQIYKAQSVKIFFANLNGLLHSMHGAVGMIRFCDSFPAKDIMDLSDCDHILSRIFQCIKCSLSGRLKCIIPAVAGSFKFTFFLSYIRSCNDSSHAPFILHRDLSCDLTTPVQICQIKCLFISTNLQYRIRRGIDNHCTCFNFFFPKFFNDLCSALTTVSNHFFPTTFFQFCDQFRWKSMFGKGFKWFFCINSHHFPVSGHRIFSVTRLFQPGNFSNRILDSIHLSSGMQIQHTKLLKIWNLQCSHSV